MTDHTKETWLTVFDSADLALDPSDMANSEYLARIKGIPPARIVAAVNACEGISTDMLGIPEVGERLQACWKACEGIPTEQLEAGGVAKLITAGKAVYDDLEIAADATGGVLEEVSDEAADAFNAALAPFRKD
ncbi:MAG: hypothetical protein ACR2RF_32105 [Geminicoccaceae bacterium]